MPSVSIEILHSLEFTQKILSIGVLIGALFTGGTIVLGIACLFLLSSDMQGFSKQSFLLRVYVTLLLLAVIVLEVAYFLAAHNFVVFHVQSTEQLHSGPWIATGMLGILIGLAPVIVTCITDGLLVWRCYVVHHAFEQTPSMWRNILWILPALLWILTIVSGIVVASITRFFWCTAAALMSNAVINIYATVFITLRLLQHRRTSMACLRSKTRAKWHAYILGLLLESAVINVPVALAAAIGLWIPGTLFPPVIGPIIGSGQAFASVLIIHQIAIGRVLDRQRDNVSGLMTEGRVQTMTEETTEEVV